MLKHLSIMVVFVLGLVLFFASSPANAQLGNSGSIDGVVKDPSGGVVAGAVIEISNPVSRFSLQATTGNGAGYTNGDHYKCGPLGLQ